jgi:predicted  nucleic acid-binding Zn-ribbon protein
MRGGNALGRAALSAKKDSARKKSMPASSASESEDSDALTDRLEKRQREKELQKALQADRDSEKAISRQIAVQKSKNDKQMQELAELRNSYPVWIRFTTSCYVSHY